jgi:uncharacterized membrane protein YecN with MAPEG domain
MTSSLYIALCGFLYIVLGIHVIRGRRLYRVVVGDGGNVNMLRRIRAQGNFAEYTPIFLILLFVSEISGLRPFCVNLFGLVYLIGRMIHTYGLLEAEKIIEGNIQGLRYRIIGIVSTFACLLGLSCYLLARYIY